MVFLQLKCLNPPIWNHIHWLLTTLFEVFLIFYNIFHNWFSRWKFDQRARINRLNQLEKYYGNREELRRKSVFAKENVFYVIRFICRKSIKYLFKDIDELSTRFSAVHFVQWSSGLATLKLLLIKTVSLPIQLPCLHKLTHQFES
jgi:hypothetical protein